MSRYAALVLAAGQGSRFRAAGGAEPTKLVTLFSGKPLVRHVVEAALGSGARPVIVVTGHARDNVAAVLAGLDAVLLHNPAFGNGLATTLKTGVAALPDDVAGVVVLLGDMPAVQASVVDRLIDAAEGEPDADAVAACHAGARGNPVLLTRSLFSAVMTLHGDSGARALLRQDGVTVRDVVFDASVGFDVDEPGDLALGSGPASDR